MGFRGSLSVVAVMVLIIGLGACSMVRSGYGWLPTAINWRLSSYFTPTVVQQARIDEHLDSLLEWHRVVELPRYAAFLGSVSAHPAVAAKSSSTAVRPAGLTGDETPRVTAPDLRAWREQAVAAWLRVVERVAEPVAEVALTLNAEQIAQIRQEVRRRLGEDRERHVAGTLEERREARYERWSKRMEWFLGPLSERQQATLAHRIKSLPDSAPWWKGREARHEAFVDLLERLAIEPPSLETATALIRERLSAGVAPEEVSQRERQSRMSLAAEALIVELLGQASPEQWTHARVKLADLMADFIALSR